MTRRGVGAFDAIGKIDSDRFRFGFYCLSMVIAETDFQFRDHASKTPFMTWRAAILKTALAPGETSEEGSDGLTTGCCWATGRKANRRTLLSSVQAAAES
jgi:hypothetical protein